MNASEPPALTRIDVHHHVVPEFYVEALARVGVTGGGGASLPVDWTADRALEVMDRHGIATAIASISAPGVHFGDPASAQQLARRCNEFVAELADRYPGRFGGFAVLPLPDVNASLKELEYALDTLRLDGVILLSSIRGGYRPAAPRFADLFNELNRRRSIVFLHPDRLPEDQDADSPVPPYLVDFVYDTTRAVAELIYSGTLHRAPEVDLIVAHAGGTVPYIAWRLVQLEKLPHYRDRLPEGVMHYLKRFYYDTALSASRYPLSCLRELAGPSRILFGSDYAFVPEAVVEASVRRLKEYQGFDDTSLADVEQGNAKRLFRRFDAG